MAHYLSAWLAWLPWWVGYWPPLVLMPLLGIGWAVEALWQRMRPGRAYLGEWEE